MSTTSSRARLTLFVVSAAILFDALDLSITQVGLPSIQNEFDMTTAAVQWVVTAYVLTYGGLLLLGGRAADLLGRRRTFVSGLVLFGAMSLVCGLAPDDAALIAARGLQGVGAALTVPAAVSIIATSFAEGEERNRALGVFGACGSAGFAVGLVAGGVLTDALGWRWIFLVKVPMVFAIVIVAMRVLVEGKAAERRRAYDLPGALLGAGGLLLLVFAITQLANSSVPRALVYLAAVLAALALIGFVLWERRTSDPLLPLAFFSMRVPTTADIASLTVLAGPFGFSFLTTLFMQNVQGKSALDTGLALLPAAILSAVMSRYGAPFLIDRIGLRASATMGLFIVAIGFAALLRMEPDSTYVSVILPASVICLGIGVGIAYPVFTIAAVTGVDDSQQGLAAGIQSTALQVGGGLGLAVVSAVVAGGLHGAGQAGRVDALHAGAVAAALLPLLGAIVAAIGFRVPASESEPERVSEPAQ